MKWINLLFNIVLALFIGVAAQTYLGLNAYATAGGILVAGASLPYLAKDMNMSFMAIQKEIWQNHIEEEIFKDNSFLRMSYNADEYVINGKVVHIPQSGGSGTVVKNRTSVPATVRKRTDTDIVYVLDEFTTDPVLIPHADTKELSYNKIQSVLGEDRDKIVQSVAEETIFNWLNSPVWQSYGATSLPAGAKLLTTGAATPATAPAATGNRKKATLTDLQMMQNYFRTQNRWFPGQMHCMLTPNMLMECFPADSVVTATYMQNVTEEERRNGILMKAQGWNIMSRSSVARTATNGDIKAPGAAGATTDDEASLFWYQQSVEFAFGGVVAFENQGDPQFYGDVYSFLARSGSRARRTGYEGIALLRQDKSS
jgi:hypothetical protein